MIDLSVLLQALPQLGVAAIFVWLYFRERKGNTELMTEKNGRINALTDRVLLLFSEHTEIITSLHNAVDNNTKALGHLAERTDKLRDCIVNLSKGD